MIYFLDKREFKDRKTNKMYLINLFHLKLSYKSSLVSRYYRSCYVKVSYEAQ